MGPHIMQTTHTYTTYTSRGIRTQAEPVHIHTGRHTCILECTHIDAYVYIYTRGRHIYVYTHIPHTPTPTYAHPIQAGKHTCKPIYTHKTTHASNGTHMQISMEA